jgi:CheY-like chemotaxis protein
MVNKLKTLIVDDESELRKSVVSVLKNMNLGIEFDIEEATNGLEALGMVKSKPYDLILMDVIMP